MQISFRIEKKFRSTFYNDADMFCFKKKFKSTSYKDTDLFRFKKKVDLHLTKMQILFCYKKNNCSNANLLTFKKKIITIIQKISRFKQKDN